MRVTGSNLIPGLRSCAVPSGSTHLIIHNCGYLRMKWKYFFFKFTFFFQTATIFLGHEHLFSKKNYPLFLLSWGAMKTLLRPHYWHWGPLGGPKPRKFRSLCPKSVNSEYLEMKSMCLFFKSFPCDSNRPLGLRTIREKFLHLWLRIMLFKIQNVYIWEPALVCKLFPTGLHQDKYSLY